MFYTKNQRIKVKMTLSPVTYKSATYLGISDWPSRAIIKFDDGQEWVINFKDIEPV